MGSSWEAHCPLFSPASAAAASLLSAWERKLHSTPIEKQGPKPRHPTFSIGWANQKWAVQKWAVIWMKMLSNENLSTPRGDWKEKDSLLLLVFYWPNSSKYQKNYFIESLIRLKKQCFFGRVKHWLVLCHSLLKWSYWKKCYMRTLRSNRECFSLFLVSHYFPRNKRSEWNSLYSYSWWSYTIGILRINWSTYRIGRC